MTRAGRKRRRIASPVLATLLLVAAGAAAIPGLSLVPIREVKIHGAFERVSKEDIEALVIPYASWGWLRLPADRLREQLESLRWVAAAEVRREWPLNLSVEIAERRPVARWGHSAMLDHAAAIFEPGDSIDRTLPVLHGPDGAQAQVLARYSEFSRRLGEKSVALEGLSLNARGGWTLQLRDGLTVRLGAESVDRRFERVLRALEMLLQGEGHEVAYIDMRYPNGFAVARRPQGGGQRNDGGISP
ncbi:MAG: cell division protein FtsQ/DivIB [Gammaproteobacteria bacterium]|nr:cell division protein FtsQ/DivIB [Gammaproteobacteria bacterium]